MSGRRCIRFCTTLRHTRGIINSSYCFYVKRMSWIKRVRGGGWFWSFTCATPYYMTSRQSPGNQRVACLTGIAEALQSVSKDQPCDVIKKWRIIHLIFRGFLSHFFSHPSFLWRHTANLLRHSVKLRITTIKTQDIWYITFGFWLQGPNKLKNLK